MLLSTVRLGGRAAAAARPEVALGLGSRRPPRTGSHPEAWRQPRGSRRLCLCPGSSPVKKGHSGQPQGGGQLPPTGSSASRKGRHICSGAEARWLVSGRSLESPTAAQPQAPSGHGVRAPASPRLRPARTRSAALWARAWLWAGRAAAGRAGWGGESPISSGLTFPESPVRAHLGSPGARGAGSPSMAASP